MLALKQSGIPIIGFKYPVVFIATDENKKEIKIDGGMLIPSKDKEEANPMGFWEVSSIALEEGLKNKHKQYGIDGDLIKVPLNALPLSDPEMVDNVIIITRDPRTVIASQIKANNIKDIKGWIKVSGLGLIHNMIASLVWLKQNKKKYTRVRYEDLIEKPGDVLDKICDVLKRGDYIWGEEIINSKLNRQKPIEDKCAEIDELERFYENIEMHYKEYDLNQLQKRIEKLSKKYKVNIEKARIEQ